MRGANDGAMATSCSYHGAVTWQLGASLAPPPPHCPDAYVCGGTSHHHNHTRPPHEWALVDETGCRHHPMTRDELCAAVGGGSRLLLLGDSLLAQLARVWQARVGLLQERGGENADTNDAEVCERGAYVRCGAARGGGAVVWWAQAPHVADGHFGKWQTREPGRIYQPPYRGMENRLWVLTTQRDPRATEDFTASDPNASVCAREMRNDPNAFGTFARPPSAWLELVGNATDVVYNQGTHVHDFVSALRNCYAAWSVEDADVVARRDAMRFLARQAGRVARLFREHSESSHDVLQARGGTHRQHGGTRFFLLTGYMSAWYGWTGGTAGGATRPLPHAAVLPPKADSNYDHDLVPLISDELVSAFLAANHSVIDVEQVMGSRVDDHKSSLTGHGDNLHFCSDGTTVNYALDLVIRHVYPTA